MQQLPEVIALHSIRTRLAFAVVDVATAAREVEDLIVGPTARGYVEAKVCEIQRALEERIRHGKEVEDRMEWIIGMAERLRASPEDEGARREAAAECGSVFPRMKASVAAQNCELRRAVRLRSELKRRVILARRALGMSADEEREVWARIDQVGKQGDEVTRRVSGRFDAAREAHQWLCDFVEKSGEPTGAPLRFGDALRALFWE